MSTNFFATQQKREVPKKRQDSASQRLCLICCVDQDFFCVGSCGHVVCFECGIRMRVLCANDECSVCRTKLNEVYITCNPMLPGRQQVQSFIRNAAYNQFGIRFENQEAFRAFDDLLANFCTICKDEPVFRTFDLLERHMKRTHELYYCDLCVKHLNLFPCERKQYNRTQLAAHRRHGDATDTSYRGHPLCEFCDERYMDTDQLYKHMRMDHYFCHFCHADGDNQFYNDYPELRVHFKEQHHLCELGVCADEQFTGVFRHEIDLKAHQSTAHGKRKQVVEVGFTYDGPATQRTGGMYQRGGRGRGGRHQQQQQHGRHSPPNNTRMAPNNSEQFEYVQVSNGPGNIQTIVRVPTAPSNLGNLSAPPLPPNAPPPGLGPATTNGAIQMAGPPGLAAPSNANQSSNAGALSQSSANQKFSRRSDDFPTLGGESGNQAANANDNNNMLYAVKRGALLNHNNFPSLPSKEPKKVKNKKAPTAPPSVSATVGQAQSTVTQTVRQESQTGSSYAVIDDDLAHGSLHRGRVLHEQNTDNVAPTAVTTNSASGQPMNEQHSPTTSPAPTSPAEAGPSMYESIVSGAWAGHSPLTLSAAAAQLTNQQHFPTLPANQRAALTRGGTAAASWAKVGRADKQIVGVGLGQSDRTVVPSNYSGAKKSAAAQSTEKSRTQPPDESFIKLHTLGTAKRRMPPPMIATKADQSQVEAVIKEPTPSVRLVSSAEMQSECPVQTNANARPPGLEPDKREYPSLGGKSNNKASSTMLGAPPGLEWAGAINMINKQHNNNKHNQQNGNNNNNNNTKVTKNKNKQPPPPPGLTEPETLGYIRPDRFDVRNKKLFNRLSDCLRPADVDSFKILSRDYRNGQTRADSFYEEIKKLLPSKYWLEVFLELLCLLPDLQKQKQLLAVYESDSSVCKENKALTNQRSPWGHSDNQPISDSHVTKCGKLHVCATCGQVLVADDLPSHRQAHTGAGDFPLLR